MKNLKKVLAGALAVVMALSLMTGAFAADFTDAADIDKTEAAGVMDATGIMIGLPDGSFDPDGVLNREQAAKMIAYLLMGAEKADKLAAVADFADVPATNWATSYIAYCAAEGIISGYAGKFYPTDDLDGYAYGKMVLTALGFDAEENGLVGDNWTTNVRKLLVAEELLDNMDDVVFSEGLSREDAAQLTLNAAKWTNASDVYSVTVGGETFDFETEASAMAYWAASGADTASGDVWHGKVPSDAGTLLLDVHGIGYEPGNDKMGRPATVYDNEDWDEGDELVYAVPADKVFTGITAEKDVFAVVGEKGQTSATIDTVYEDGYLGGNGAPLTVNKTGASAGWNAPYFGNGITVELFQDAETKAWTAVATREYLATVTDEIEATDDEGRKIEVTLDTDAWLGDECAAYETDEFAVEDKVVVTVSQIDGETIEIMSIKAVEKVENVAITAMTSGNVNNASVTAGGKVYSFSQNTVETVAALDYVMGGGATYTLLVDSFGNILDVEEYNVVSKDYVMVIDIADETESTGAFGNVYTSVKYVDMAGVESIVKVWDDATVADGADDGDDNEAEEAEVYGWYTVKADKDHDGYFVFEAVEGEGDKANGVSDTLEALNKTQPIIAGEIKANASTVFVLKTDADPVAYKVVTGIANVPGYTGETAAYAVVEKGYAVVVYIDVTSVDADSATADELVYLLEVESTAVAYDEVNDVNYYSFKAIVDGKLTVIKSQESALIENVGEDACGAGLAKITRYDNLGYVQYVEDIENGDGDGVYTVATLEDNTVIDFSAPTLVVGVEAYLMADNAVVYMVDADDNLKVTNATALKGDVDGESNIYLIAVSKDDATVATIYFDGAID